MWSKIISLYVSRQTYPHFVYRSLGMDTVYVHKYAGILSAYGMALADVIHEEQAPCVIEYSEVVSLFDDFQSKKKTKNQKY